MKYIHLWIFINSSEKIFKLKTENRDREQKTLAAWIPGQVKVWPDQLISRSTTGNLAGPVDNFLKSNTKNEFERLKN